MRKTQQLVVSANLCLIVALVLSACSTATQTNLPVTQTNLSAYPNFAPTPTPRVTSPAYPTIPTAWRDYTPTPNSTPGAWPEFSSQFTFTRRLPDGIVVGPLYYSVRYPPDWYLYPGPTVIYAGEARGTDIQNYKGVTNQESLRLEAGRAHLMLIARACNSTEQGCPVGLPLLSPGFPGTQEVRLDEFNHLTYWNTFLYINDMQFAMYGVMFGTPEENVDLIKTLDEILATVVVHE